MTTKVSFACIDDEHWACPDHLGVVAFPCDCPCHHVEPLSDTTTGRQGDTCKHRASLTIVNSFTKVLP